MKTLRRLAAAVALALAFPALAYQVTGPVVEVTDSKIVVMKGKEKWELARTPETKVTGKLEKDAKVTVEYTMTAKSIEVKPAKSTKKK